MKNVSPIAVGLFAGLVGGALSHYLFTSTPVHAQTGVPASLEIRAQKFVLVDEHGVTRGAFGSRSNGSPDLQVDFGKPTGLKKLISAEVGSVHWVGVERKDVCRT